MKYNSPMIDRVLDSLNRKIRQTEINSFSRQGLEKKEETLDRLKDMYQKVQSRRKN